MIASNSNSFSYYETKLSDIRVNAETDDKGKVTVKSVDVCDERCLPTSRFWSSLMSRYGFAGSIFKYYSHEEVFNRIATVAPSEAIRVCVNKTTQVSGQTHSHLLAASAPKAPIMEYDQLMGILEQYDGVGEVSYADGIVTSIHTPRINQDLTIGPDQFGQRFTMATPIDGYGMPNTYLTFLRLLCQNGMVAWSKIFRSSLTMGKGDDDVEHTVTRAIESFANDEGFAAYRQRIELAMQSPASVHEAYRLLDILHNLTDREEIRITGVHQEAPTLKEMALRSQRSVDANNSLANLYEFYKSMTGDLSSMYGMVSAEGMSVKKQKALPTRARVMDLINFGTEVATHHSTPVAARVIAGWLGGVVGEEFDLEGVDAGKIKDFAAFSLDQRLIAGATGSV